MDWKPRLIEPAELDAMVDLSSTVFGVGPTASASYRQLVAAVVEVDRTFVVDDGATIVGTGGHFTFDVALPGGAALPIGAITEVGVLPTHRRRGVLTAIMGALLDQSVERGEPLAGLTASEASIYRRYGFGVATRCHTLLIHTPRAAAALVATPDPGRFRLVGRDEAAELLPAVWAKRWRRVPGELSRKPSWWEKMALDPEDERDGASARYVVVHEDAGGAPDGFAAYRLKDGAAPGDYFELQVDDLAAGDDRVEALVLRYLLEVDLVRRVRWVGAPVDLSLPWGLVDRRAVEVVGGHDHLWLRLLDVPRCLTARSYAAEGGGVIEVVDTRRPGVGGRFALDAGPGGADCARVTVEPDVVLDVADLGALLLGGVRWSTLQRAGMVDERTPGAVDRLDALFRPSRAPHCATDF